MDAVDDVLQPARGDDGRYGAGKREADEDDGAVTDIGPLEDGGDAGSENLADGGLFPAVLGVEEHQADDSA